jgi:hypothetical protein
MVFVPGYADFPTEKYSKTIEFILQKAEALL